MVCTAIERNTIETIVNFEPKSNCQYHLSSSVGIRHNTCQQRVDIFILQSEINKMTNKRHCSPYNMQGNVSPISIIYN